MIPSNFATATISLPIFIFVIIFMKIDPSISNSIPNNTITNLRIQPELDFIDINTYLQNERSLQYQLNCLLKEENCDNIGKFLQSRFPNMLYENKCDFCTDKQATGMKKFISYLKDKNPDLLNKIQDKYLLKKKDKEEEFKKSMELEEKEKERRESHSEKVVKSNTENESSSGSGRQFSLGGSLIEEISKIYIYSTPSPLFSKIFSIRIPIISKN